MGKLEVDRSIKKHRKIAGSRLWESLLPLGITALIARLFYRSVVALVLYVPISRICIKYRSKKQEEQRKRKLRKEFQECMELVAGNLLAGYALENAFAEAEKELTELLGEESPMKKELVKMNRKIQMNQPIEKVFAEFARQSGVEEIQQFSEVMIFAKRSGGNFVKIIQETARNIGDKIMVEEEIETMIAARKLEQKVMNLVPLFLLAYLDIVSGGYLDVLYGNVGGALLMTVCLAGYGAALLLAERMSHIEV